MNDCGSFQFSSEWFGGSLALCGLYRGLYRTTGSSCSCSVAHIYELQLEPGEKREEISLRSLSNDTTHCKKTAYLI